MNATTIDEARMSDLVGAAFSEVKVPDDVFERVMGTVRAEERARVRRGVRAARPARGLRMSARAATVAVALTAVTATGAYAAVSSGFLQGAFGDKGQPDVAATVVDSEGSPYTLPAMTWEGTDEETAASLVGDYVTESGGSVTTQGVTLTVGGVVEDDNGLGVATYTLSSPQGLGDVYGDAGYGEFYALPDAPVSDVTVGASPAAPTSGTDASGDATAYDSRSVKDLQQTTDDELHAVMYFASADASQAGGAVSWWLPQADATDACSGDAVSLALKALLPSSAFAASGDDLTAHVSPIGVVVEGSLLADGTSELGDLSLALSDGSTYVVSGEDVMNSTLAYRRDDGSVAILFNRLVDTDKVTSVSVDVVSPAQGSAAQDEHTALTLVPASERS